MKVVVTRTPDRKLSSIFRHQVVRYNVRAIAGNPKKSLILPILADTRDM